MKIRFFTRFLSLPLVIALHGNAGAVAVNKHSSGTDLTVVGAWETGAGPVPGASDVATWNTGSLGGALTIGSALSWQGIDIQAATAAITTSGAGVLTLGSSGINIASGGVDLNIVNSVTVGAAQNWTVASGRTFTTSSGGKTLAINNTLTLDGAGIVFIGGSSGSTTLTGSANLNINNGRLAWGTQTGSTLTGYSGQFVLNSGGKLSINTGNTLPALTINGGTIGSFSSTARTETGALTIGGDFTVGGNETASVIGNISTGLITFSGMTDLGGAVRSINSQLASGQGVKFSGVVSNGGITVNGNSAGIVTLSNNSNTYTGATTVTSGYLAISLGAIANSSSISLAANTRLFVGDNGITTINDLSGVSTAGIRSDFNLNTGNGARTLSVNQTADGTFAGTFTEGGSRAISLVKTGTAKLTLSGTGGYTGGTTLSQGTLAAITNNGALGSSGTVTINDANTGSNNTALLLGNITMARPVTVANQGSGTTTLGANGSAALPEFSGAITLAKDVTLNGTGSTDRLTFSGGIGGSGNVIVSGGTNRVVFATTANTYSGTTTISANSILQLGTGGSSTTSLIPDASVVTVNSGGFLKLAKGSNSETIGGLSGSGTVRGHEGVASVASTLTIDGGASQNFSGVLEDGGASGSTLNLTKSGGGTQTISGTSNSYTGNTLVSGGKLVINGNISTSTLTTVQTGAALGGSGTVGALNIDGGGTLAPGNSPGTLSTGTLTLADTSILSFELNPSNFTVGSNINDLIGVTGNLTLDGILNLVATSGNFLSAVSGDKWRLFNYSGSLTDNTLGFGSMPTLTSGLEWSLDTATAGQVNLVVVPEPGAALLGGLGMLALLRRRR